MTRILVHAAVIAAALATQALADERVLLLSAYPPEQAVLLAAAGVDGPEDRRPVRQTVFHDARRPSRILLPVVPR